MRHQGAGLEAMRAVATAHKKRSLHDFEAALRTHAEHLGADPIISTHLKALYDMLLQENICRIIEPYSTVTVSHRLAPSRTVYQDLSPSPTISHTRWQSGLFTRTVARRTVALTPAVRSSA